MTERPDLCAAATLPVWPDVGHLLNIGRDASYDLAATGWIIPNEVPCWRIRGQYRVGARLYEALGLEPADVA